MIKHVQPVIHFFSKKSVIAMTVALVVLIGIRFATQNAGNNNYIVEKVARSSIVEVVSETGNVTSAGSTPIYSTTTGMVEDVYVENGSFVQEGQTLFKVKSTATKQEKDAALSDYMAAQNALESAKATQYGLQADMFAKWDTFKELAESDDYEDGDGNPKHDNRALPEFHIPEKEWLSAEAEYKNQEQVISELSVAKSAAWQAYQATQDSEVVAVLGGEVQNLGVTRGDLIVAPTTTTLSETSPAMVVVDPLVRPYINVMVNETDIIKIQPGQNATVTFDAIDNKEFAATVDRVDTIATVSQDIVQYGVYVTLLDQNQLIRRGMTADVDITIDEKQDTLTVPSNAVKPYQGQRAVRLVGEDGEIEFVPVEIGLRGDTKTEILSGIEEGTEVVVALDNEQTDSGGGLF